MEPQASGRRSITNGGVWLSRPIPYRTRRRILDLYLRGESLDEISKKTGVSKGTSVSVAKEIRRGGFPKIQGPEQLFEELRFLSVTLRKNRWTVEQAILGNAVLEWLGTLNVPLEKVKDWMSLCQDLSSEDYPTEEFVAVSLEMREEEKKRGKGFDEIWEEFSILEKRAGESVQKAAKAEVTLEGLDKKSKKKRAELSLLESVGSLKATKEDLIRQQEEARVRRDLALEQAGVSDRALNSFIAFRSTIEGAGYKLTSKRLQATARLVAERTEKDISRLLELNSAMRERGEDIEASLRGLRMLEDMEGDGFYLGYWSSLKKALEGKKLREKRAFDWLADAIKRYASLRTALSESQHELNKLRRIEAEWRETILELEGLETDASGRLQEIQTTTERLEEEGERLSSEIGKHQEERDELLGIRKALALDVEERQRSLAEVLEVQCRWEDVDAAIRDKRGEIDKLQEEIDAMKERFDALDWLESSLKGDLKGARLFFDYLAREPYSLVTSGRPGPWPDEARKKLVSWILQLLSSEVVSLREHETMTRDYEKKLESTQKWTQEESMRVMEDRKAKESTHARIVQEKDRHIRKLKEDKEDLEKRARKRADTVRYLEIQLDDLKYLLPLVKGQTFETVEEFYAIVRKSFSKAVEQEAQLMYASKVAQAMRSGNIVAIGQYSKTLVCPDGHQWQLQVDPKYMAEAISGRRSGARLPRLQCPGFVVEYCPTCGSSVNLELKDLI